MDNFNYTQYIEHKRAEKGIKQNKVAELIGCSGSNYANKVSRESFNFEEIAKICNLLDINLNNLQLAISIDNYEISEALDNLRYAGNNNYYRNESGFLVVENILFNEVMLNMLDKDIKFEIGYLMLSVSPNHNGYGIRQAEFFFNNLFKTRKKIDLDVLTGMLFCSFYKLNQENILHLHPKYLYFPNLLEYILDSYDIDSILYIFKNIDEKTQLSTPIYIYIAEVNEIIQHYLGDNFSINVPHSQIDNLISIIRKIISTKITNKIIEHELERFLLKITYIRILHFNI